MQQWALSSVIPRTRTLHLNVTCTEQLNLFSNSLRSAAPHILSVTICIRRPLAFDGAPAGRPNLFGGSAGALKYLALDYGQQWILPRDHYPHLTELSIINRNQFSSRASALRLDVLLGFLGNMPNLETLSIHDTNHGRTRFEVHSHVQKVHLSRLRGLSIVLHDSSVVAALSSALSTPDESLATLAGRLGRDDMIAANVPYHLTIPPNCRQVVLRQIPHHWLSILSACNGQTTVHLGLQQWYSRSNMPLQVFDSMRSELANVNVLRVECSISRVHKTPDRLLQPLIKPMDMLTHLSVRDYRGFIIPQLADILRPAGLVPCPSLTSITLSILAPRGDFTTELHPLLHVTELRAAAGAPLRRLTVCTPQSPGTVCPNDVSFFKVHGLTWLSFCSRDLYYGCEEDQERVLRPGWHDIWGRKPKMSYEDRWRACEEAGAEAPSVLPKIFRK